MTGGVGGTPRRHVSRWWSEKQTDVTDSWDTSLLLTSSSRVTRQ